MRPRECEPPKPLTVEAGMVREVVAFACRYSIFRQTTSSCEIAAWVQRHLGDLDYGTRSIIARDIREEFATLERTQSWVVPEFAQAPWAALLEAIEDMDGEEIYP